jgi:hypothetical protein
MLERRPNQAEGNQAVPNQIEGKQIKAKPKRGRRAGNLSRLALEMEGDRETCPRIPTQVPTNPTGLIVVRAEGEEESVGRAKDNNPTLPKRLILAS